MGKQLDLVAARLPFALLQAVVAAEAAYAAYEKASSMTDDDRSALRDIAFAKLIRVLELVKAGAPS